MTAEAGQWDRVKQILQSALDLAPTDRSSFLDTACAADLALRTEIESLLAAHADAGSFAERPAIADLGGSMPGEQGGANRRRLRPDDRVGPYQIVDCLGVGGMGEVYRARDLRLKRDIAIKVLSESLSLDPDRLKRFQREAELLATLNHPHIGAIYGLEDLEGMPALVLELVEGETLAERITRGPLSLEEASAIGRQIAEALEAAHEQAIVHRDLKPANIKITPGGTVKVLDFGLAKAGTLAAAPDNAPTVTVARTEAGMILGTAAYMSPEQARGQIVDKRADIWAFGCVFYEMLIGVPLHPGDTSHEIVASILRDEPDLSQVPPQARRLLKRCLEKDVQKRLRHIGDVMSLLDEPPSDQYAAPTVASSAPFAAPEPPPDAPRHNLPAELTSFVGRRKELLELPGLLASSRLLSLTGAGGVGKTRLAVRLAYDVVNEFPDGVWMVDLAPLSVPDLVAQTIATAVGVREGPQRSARDALLDNLRHRHLLLVLDNCEHLIDACAQLVEVLLRGAPSLRIVATSREALGVPGEMVRRVPSLSLPEAIVSLPAEGLLDFEATQLFVERAAAIDPSFGATVENAGAIARICRRLDGIPLAIELAAARVVVLSPEQIDTRLQDRFRLLTGGSRTAVARQRTLEATVDWSYQLLSDAERQLFGRLSVFPAGWTLDAAEKVCGGDGIDANDMLDLLSTLVSKSLVAVESDFAGERRYRLLETVRQYARERLVQAGATDRLRERHFEFFFNEFRGVRPILRGHGQLPCLRRLRIEQESVRAALEWALTSDSLAEKGVELAGALFWYWTKRGLFEEGRLWLEQALDVGQTGPLRARALIGLAHMHTFQGRQVEVEALAAEALSLGREAGDAWVVSFALFLQGLAAFEQGDHDQAAARSLEAREAADRSGEGVQHGGPLLILANIAVASGDHDRAQQLYDESMEVHRVAGEVWGLSILLSAAAGLRIIRQDFDQARAQASEAMSLCQELEDPRGIAWSLDVFAGLLAAAGYADAAARLWGASDGLLASVGGSLVPTIGWIRDRYFEPMKTALGDESFETARAEGRAMPPVRAIALARQQALLLG